MSYRAADENIIAVYSNEVEAATRCLTFIVKKGKILEKIKYMQRSFRR